MRTTKLKAKEQNLQKMPMFRKWHIPLSIVGLFSVCITNENVYRNGIFRGVQMFSDVKDSLRLKR